MSSLEANVNWGDSGDAAAAAAAEGLDPEILVMPNDEIRQRIRLLDNEVRIMRSDIQRINHESNSQRERIKENNEKVKLNKQLPYLVGNVVEILELEDDEDEQDGAATDVDAQRKGKSAVIKTSTRQTIFLPIPGLVDSESLVPNDLVGTNKDSYLILEKLPAEYDSRVKAMEVDEKPTEEYSDIGGLDKQIQELVEAVVLPMTHKEKFEAIGIQPPKGVLLHGPPGTGKTLLARACAKQTDAIFLKLAAPQLVQMFIGDGAKLVRDAFDLAKEKCKDKEKGGAIIFIDELDAIGTKRFGGEQSGDREVQRTMLELLNQLDGFTANTKIKVIAATNRPDVLDPALLRSGRLDRKIELPHPTEEARARILQIHSRKMNVDMSDVNFDELARSTDDFNGAQLKAVCVEAGMLALRRESDIIKHEDFMEGIGVVSAKKKASLQYYARSLQFGACNAGRCSSTRDGHRPLADAVTDHYLLDTRSMRGHDKVTPVDGGAPASPTADAPDAGASPGPRQTTLPPALPKQDSTRSLPSRINIRRGSKGIKPPTSVTSHHQAPVNLDLDAFYQARLRRRTHLAQEITTTLARVGVGATPMEPVSAMTKSRGIMMTLSPGEEYENYQKVNAANRLQTFDPNLLAAEEASRIDEEEREEARAAAAAAAGGAAAAAADSRGDTSGERENDAATGDKPDSDRVVKETTGVSASAVMAARKKAIADGSELAIAMPGQQMLDVKSLQASPTLRRLVNHSSLRTQAIAALKGSTKMIHPHGSFRLGWDVMSIVFIFYNAIVLPFQASFHDSQVEGDVFEQILDMFFLIDIAVTFNTAIELDGSIRFSRRVAAKTYVTSWFIIDLVAALPYDYILPPDDTISSNVGVNVRRSLKLLRLIRLLRLFRVSRIFQRIQSAIFIRSTLTALVKYLLMVMFVSHWFSCAFHAIGSASRGHNWIVANGLNDPLAGHWDRYVAALYFAVMTLATIGFGDISGTNADERLFCIFAMIMGGGIFAYGITNIVELVSSLTVQETRFRQKMDEVNEYMAARELPLKLRMDIREFYHNTRLSRESKLNAEQQILSELSSKLRSKIALSINDQFLRKFPFFAGSDPNFLMELALNMRMIHFAPLEDVIIEGEIGHEMFFIFRGAVEVLRGGQQIGILGENQYFGEMAILSPDNRRRATVRTLCFCELRMLSRNRFLEALALFPAMQTKMTQVAQSRQPQQRAPSPSKASFKKEKSDRSTKTADSNGPTLPPPELSQLKRQPTMTKLPIANAVTSSSFRIQQAEQRSDHAFIPRGTSSRMSIRRQGSGGGGGLTASMVSALSEAANRLDESTRRQELLIARVLKLQTELSQLRAPLP
ncbi:hypothetical protein P43SY_008192 [Pythium insidiosum]|uniref:Cyclic nucleotide-binding domain-containing protein n=1 Tax=Pythium insidiosum TaxID=114742 RepID=A0AAD5Q5G6_PYTIN|nr:hypothetical protein P43SY_008192 [Pythium insidiosum]